MFGKKLLYMIPDFLLVIFIHKYCACHCLLEVFVLFSCYLDGNELFNPFLIIGEWNTWFWCLSSIHIPVCADIILQGCCIQISSCSCMPSLYIFMSLQVFIWMLKDGSKNDSQGPSNLHIIGMFLGLYVDVYCVGSGFSSSTPKWF